MNSEKKGKRIEDKHEKKGDKRNVKNVDAVIHRHMNEQRWNERKRLTIIIHFSNKIPQY